MLRAYDPVCDANTTYELAKRLFQYSPFFDAERLEDFALHYGGWIIEEHAIVAFLLCSKEALSAKLDAWYIDFVGSARRGYGQRLMDVFLHHVDEQGSASFLHVEIGEPERANRLISWYERNGFRIHAPIIGPLEAYMLPQTVTMVRAARI